MSAFVLKLLALLSMVVDHTAAVLLYASPLYDPLRAFGRMAFLVYAFSWRRGSGTPAPRRDTPCAWRSWD